MEEMSKVQDAIDAANAWELDRQLEIAMDAMRLPPGRRQPTTLSGGERRRVALCKTLLAEARPAAARRADQPSRRRIGGLAGTAPCRNITGTVVAVTHDRYFLDNVAEWILELDRGRGHPYKGNYSGWLEQKRRPLAKRGDAPSRPGARPWLASWSGRGWPPGPAWPRARPVSAPTKSWPARNTRSARTNWSCRSRPARTSATWSSGPRACARPTATTCSWRT